MRIAVIDDDLGERKKRSEILIVSDSLIPKS